MVAQLAEEVLRRRHRQRAATGEIEKTWQGWVRQMFPGHVTRDFAPYHRIIWRWVWGIRPDERPQNLVGILPRGWAKSTTAQMAAVALGVPRFVGRPARKYCVYLSETQDKADRHVESIAGLLESEEIARYYPELGRRKVGKYGSPKGWRRSRLWTRSGFVVDALGMETSSVRGLKVVETRPDLLILDDLDGLHDTPAATKKKIEILTQSILPIGDAERFAVMALQNLILPDGIFARLADGRADFLSDRKVVGPFPAVDGLRIEPQEREDGTIRHMITAGRPTWPAMGLDVCQDLVDLTGPRAFLREQQHEVSYVEGAMWRPETIRHAAAIDEPIVRAVVGVDPSGGSAEIGIVAAALLASGKAVVWRDGTQSGKDGVQNWADAVWEVYDSLECDAVVAEKNFGGNMVEKVIRDSARGPMAVKLVSASRGKMVRAEPVVQKYERGEVVHLGRHGELESEMLSWVPGQPGASPNRVDALVWALTELFWGRTKTRLVWGKPRKKAAG